MHIGPLDISKNVSEYVQDELANKLAVVAVLYV